MEKNDLWYSLGPDNLSYKISQGIFHMKSIDISTDKLRNLGSIQSGDFS